MKILVFNNYSLLPHNTFGLNLKAATFIEYASVDDLKAYIAQGMLKPPFLHIGQGSNLLFLKDYEGTILHSAIQGIEVVGEDEQFVSVRVGAGVSWDDFVDYCVKQGWYGIENLSLIPGEVGASAVQNIGAYGVEASDLIAAVETVTAEGEERMFDVAECEYSYRNSIFKRTEMKSHFVTHVHFRLSKQECYHLEYGNIRKYLEATPHYDLATVRKAIVDIRKSKLPDPEVLGNAGSFFVNPMISKTQFDVLNKQYPEMPCYDMGNNLIKVPAGWLIEQCGWKGQTMGKAGVYEKQALVLVNRGGASADEIVALSNAIIKSVHDKFGIDIHPEVNFVG